MSINPTENSRTYVGFVVERDDPTNTGGHKIFCPQIHGKDVNIDHLPFCRFSVAAGQGHASTNQGALDYGQMVFFQKDKGQGGTGHGTITGLPQTKRKSNPNMPGNISLVSYIPQIRDAINKEVPIQIRPDIEEKMEDGARVREKKEKNKKHKHSLLDELSSAGAAFPLNGTVLPQVKNVSTAVEKSFNTLTAAMQGGLPGMSASLGNILNLIPAQLKNELMNKLPPDVMTALTNTTNLMGSVSTMAVNGASSGGLRIDPEKFAQNAVNLLSNMKNTQDVASVISELQTNPSLSGIASAALSFTVNTPFGEITQKIDSLTGALSSSIPNSIQNAINSFTSLVSSIPGAGNDQVFGDSSQVIADMGQRLALPEKIAEFKEKLEKNMSTALGTEPRKKLNEKGASRNSAIPGAKKFLG